MKREPRGRVTSDAVSIACVESIRLAELIDTVLAVARRIRATPFTNPQIISIRPAERAVMRHVTTSPGDTPSVIARSLGFQRANLSRSLNSLEDLGLITRLRKEDGRYVGIWPTKIATENWGRIRDEWASRAARTLRSLDNEDIGQFLSWMKTLEDGLGDDLRDATILDDEG